MSEFITLKKFNNIQQADLLLELLKKNNLEFQLLQEKPDENSVFAGNTAHEYVVNVKGDDLDAAEKLVDELEDLNVDTLDKDYYLFEFTDDELLDILKKPDEWSFNDYTWAQEILRQREKEVDSKTIDTWKNDRLLLLSQPETLTLKYIILSYFFCLTGGIIGVFMGRHFSTFRKTLPNGKKVYAYDEKGRKLGYRISIIGLLCLITWIILLFSLL